MDLEEALNKLLPGGRTGDLHADLVAAAREAWDRRRFNSLVGGIILAALQDPEIMGKDDKGRSQALSLRDIERETEIPRQTAARWALPPGTAD